jgi:anaerobic magnesium-protoporphyrin IX monomethyl ester cyclase
MGITKAFLVNPPNPPGHVSNKDSMGGFGQLYPPAASAFPPLDLPYLAATLTAAALEPKVFEAGAMRWSVDELCRQIDAAGGAQDALLVVRTSLPTIDWDLEVCAALRARCRAGAILVYGPVVGPLLWRVQREPAVDYAVVGDPDQPVLELLRARPAGEIAGLAWRAGGEWRRNPERRFEQDLDAQPFPRWDLFPIERYTIPKSSTAGTLRFLPMLSSRGCPFGCSYCPYPVGQGLPWRDRSPENVVDELQHLVRDLGVQYVIFRDPLFSADKKRVRAICEQIFARGIKLQWRCETRIDCLDEPTIALMAKAGCVGVNFGVESIDPQVQKNVERKPITEAQFVETMGQFRRHGIATFAFFVVGLPGDTVDTILRSIRFGLRLGASWTQFTVATPFIGTRLHDWAVEQGFVARDHYRIISAHEGSIGNENLTPGQVHRLHRFAQILQRNFINRRGILKNELRRDPAYRLAKGALDLLMKPLEWAFFHAGSALLRLSMPRARRGAATTVTHKPRKPVFRAGS